MRAAIVAVMASLVLSGCGSSATSAPTPSPTAIQHGRLTVGGLARTYRVFRPPALDPQHPAPLVLLLHQCGSRGDLFASITHFDDRAAAVGFVAAYPDGADDCWNEFLEPSKADDLTFIEQLIDRLTADLPIDRNRIFVAGLQSGGHMAYTLACAVPERLAGIASVSGGMPLDSRKTSMRCSGTNQSKAVSVLELHGTADSFIPYGGGGPLDAPATVDLVKYWAMVDGCSGDPTVSQNGITKTSVWKQCRGGTVVRLDAVTGGNNTWFGSTLDPVLGEPNASVVVWDFFSSLPPRA